MARRDFSGRCVAITGAGGGLGRALALRFVAAGARVAALDRDAVGLERVASELRAVGAQFVTLVCDVSSESECRSALARSRQVLGAVDVLVNNAGITHRSAFQHTDPAVIRKVMEVNFFGALHCTHAAMPDLVARSGMLIAVSSVAGFAPLIARTGYAASKHALHGFFGSLRTELAASGVSVMLVCPSFIATGIEKNALAGDGGAARHPQSIVGARLTPEVMAERIFDAATRDLRLLLPDRVSRLSWWVSRLAPRLYERLMTRKLGEEMRGQA